MKMGKRKMGIRQKAWFDRVVLGAMVFAVLAATGAAAAERIKDISTISGVRSNQLVGYGLVVGLDGTGDQTPFTEQSLRSMLATQGVTVPPDVDLRTDNVAAVMVSAELPAFARSGQRIDITVSSIGNAETLQGGELLMTPLRGVDDRIYAVAQGSVIVGGLGSAGAQIDIETPGTASMPRGAIVERRAPSNFADQDEVVLNLNTPDFTTARRTAEVINEQLGPNTARAADAVTVRVRAPRDPDRRVSFISFLEELRVTPGEAPARVIVNARTGTIVMGSKVRVLPAAVTHGSMTVAIEGAPEAELNGEAAADGGEDSMFVFEPGADLNEIVNAVNSVGASPGDLVAILEALKAAGALRAELLVI